MFLLGASGFTFAQELDSLNYANDTIQDDFDDLSDEVFQLEETVVVGYGRQKKGDLTSSISSAKAEDITKQPATTAMQSLQGKMTGVNIINSDQPGKSPTVIIRGLGTALGGRDPLYIVDGLIVPNINNINPRDIESIDVMKDAASAAIYGVRGANGVIFVTTKKGKSGKVKINYDTYVGFRNVLNKIDMANGSEYVQYFNEETKSLGKTQLLSADQPYNTNWFDELVQTGMMTNNNVTLSGGAENVTYYFGIDHFTDKGFLEGQNYRRTTVRNNNEYKLFDNKVRITQNISATFTKENVKPLGAFDTAHRQSPLVPVKYEDGKWGQPFWNGNTGQVTYIGSTGKLNSHGNPVSSVYYANEVQRSTTLQGFLQADVDIVDGLTFTSRAGATKYWYNAENFVPTKELWLAGDPTRTETEFANNGTNAPSDAQWARNSYSINKIETFRWQWENYVTYNKKFGKHNINAVAGFTAEEEGVGNVMYGLGYNVPDQQQYWSIDRTDNSSTGLQRILNQSYYTPLRHASYFGRFQYNFDSRYYLSAIVRRDGSSRFKENQLYWETFPSFSAGWTISNEEFLKGNSFINFLKLRGGWGRLGNDNIDVNNVTAIYAGTGSENYNYVFGPGQALIFGAYMGTPAKNLTWEITEEYGGGLDFTLLDNKLTGSVDYYNKTTKNAILNIAPLLSSPYANNFYDHAAEIVNKGWEFSLAWQDRSASGDFSYKIGGNISFNDNEVTKVNYNYLGMTGGSLGNGQITKSLAVGQPVGAWWMYEVEGVYQNQAEIDNSAHVSGAKPGFLKYKDQNGDGVIDARDKKYFGSYIPKYTYGINISFTYKNIDFNIDGYGVGGNKVYNGLNNTRLGGENISKYMFDNRWTGEGSTNVNPGANRDVYASNYYLEKGDYLRINNITLGYNFRDKIPGVANLRIYATAMNPFLFTKYEGYTPELIGNGDPYGLAGVELTAYPNTKSFLMGINVEF